MSEIKHFVVLFLLVILVFVCNNRINNSHRPEVLQNFFEMKSDPLRYTDKMESHYPKMPHMEIILLAIERDLKWP